MKCPNWLSVMMVFVMLFTTALCYTAVGHDRPEDIVRLTRERSEKAQRKAMERQEKAQQKLLKQQREAQEDQMERILDTDTSMAVLMPVSESHNTKNTGNKTNTGNTASGATPDEDFNSFGVGIITFRTSPEAIAGPLSMKHMTIQSEDRRVFYPVTDFNSVNPKVKEILTERNLLPSFVQGIVKQSIDNSRPRCRVFFLFKGIQPLRITLGTNPPTSMTLQPVNSPFHYSPLMNLWWSEYTKEQTNKPFSLHNGTPPLIQNYLRCMLARRLQLPANALAPKKAAWEDITPFDFISSTTWLRSKLPYEVFFADRTSLITGPDSNASEEATAPEMIPVESITPFTQTSKSTTPKTQTPKTQTPESQASQSQTPAPDGKLVEPIAFRVPQNCAYIRFGSYANFVWFQDFLGKTGGAANQLIAAQSWNYNTSKKIETQLAVRQTELSRMMGPTVVKDVAFVASDLFLEDGASFGILFHASNSFFLGQSLLAERGKYVKENPGTVDQTVTLDGKRGRYMSSPDNRFRSWYFIDGMFHFVTNSRTLMEQFLRTGKPETKQLSASGDSDSRGEAVVASQPSLGQLPEFVQARTRYPLDRHDSVFLYASEPFLNRLVSPSYWIEIQRRRRSAAEIQMANLARQSAINEGMPDTSLETLVYYGWLPASVIARPDGSRLVLDQDGIVSDSVRGRLGYFLPAADVKTEVVSPYETQLYESMIARLTANQTSLDPMIAAIQRKTQPSGNERLTIAAEITPLGRGNYQKLQQYFGPVDNVRLAPIAGDWLSFQMILNNGRLFGGVRDRAMQSGNSGRPVMDILSEIVGESLPLYVATTGDGGFISLLQTAGILAAASGRTYSITDTPDQAMRQRDTKSRFLTVDQTIVNQVQPQLKYVKTKTPAQVWLTVRDPMTLPIGQKVNDMAYAAAVRTTLDNLIMLQTLNQQLGIAPSQGISAAEYIFGAELICPIDGQYEYYQATEKTGYWTASRLGGNTVRNLAWTSVQAPAGVKAVPWNWFRGLYGSLAIHPNNMTLNAVMEMADTKTETETEVPAP